MIGDHPVRGLASFPRPEPRFSPRSPRSAAEQIRFIIVVGALQDRGDSLQPHARVDGWLGQADALLLLTCSYCMNTRFQISMKRSPSASALPGGPPGILSP